VVLRMLANVQQRTIKPIITAAVTPGTLVHTDEYSIYARLPAWGYGHKTVRHGRGEYARDEDSDGFCDPDAVLLASPGRRAVETVRLFAPPGMDVLAEAARLTEAAATETEGLRAIPGSLAVLASLPQDRWVVVTLGFWVSLACINPSVYLSSANRGHSGSETHSWFGFYRTPWSDV